MNFTALVVEDDTLQRETLADLLKDESLEVIESTSAEAAELVVAISPPYIPKDASFLLKPYRPRKLLNAILTRVSRERFRRCLPFT